MFVSYAVPVDGWTASTPPSPKIIGKSWAPVEISIDAWKVLSKNGVIPCLFGLTDNAHLKALSDEIDRQLRENTTFSKSSVR